MKLSEFPIIADENIKASLVDYLRGLGFNLKSVREENLFSSTDASILKLAKLENRVILTQDDDFAKIVFTHNIYFAGIIHLRPGHLVGDIHISTLKAILELDADLETPFIISATNSSNSIKIKVRHFPKLK